MSHLVAFPEDMYQAIAKYAAEHGQTAEDVIFAWGKAIKDQVIFSQAIDDEAVSSQAVDDQMEEAVYNPENDPLAKYLGAGEAIYPVSEHDPWAGFHGAFIASPSDLLEQHDKYLAEDLLDNHTSKQ